MQLYAKKQEFKTLRTLCAGKIDEGWRFSILGKLSPEHFHTDPVRSAINRIRAHARERHTLPTWDELMADPVLSEDVREVLTEERIKPYNKLKSLESAFTTLEKYRRIRSLYFACKETIEGLTAEEVDIDVLLENHGNSVAKAYTTSSSIEEQTLTFGEGDDASLEYAKEALDAPTEVLLKTGYNEYDQKNGGLPSSGVMLMAATTSGGKSVTSMNLLLQLYMLNNIDVCRVSLEMLKQQELFRFMSRISGVQFSKIRQQKLTPTEKKHILKKLKDFNSNPKFRDEWIGKRRFKQKRKFTTITPTDGMSMESLLNMLKPYGHKVVAIDYVGLLEGMSGERQWLMLSEAIRLAKNFTKVTGSLVIILCQLSEEDKLRYSHGMKEHADVLWQWNYAKPEIRETKQLPIDITKARDGELFQMMLDEAFEYMRVSNPKNGSQTSSDPRSSAEVMESPTGKGRVLG